MREFECPLLPLPELPEPDPFRDNLGPDLDAEAARLSAYRLQLEKEIRVAEEKSRIEALLVRRASARPPAPVRDSEVTRIRPLPSSPKTRSIDEEFARPILSGTFTRPPTQTTMTVARYLAPAPAPARSRSDEPWSEESALTDAALVVDRARLASEPLRGTAHSLLVPVFGVALALLLAAFVTRGEERSAFGSYASAPATTLALPARVEAAAITSPVTTAPVVTTASPVAAPTPTKRSTRRTTHPLVAAPAAPAAPAEVAAAAPSPTAAPAVSEPASSPELEQAARTAKMLRAQLDGVVVQ